MGSHLFCRFLSRTTQHWCCAIALLLATSPTVNASIWINEFDYDQPGTDSAEFIELVSSPGMSITPSDISIVLYNGASSSLTAYNTISGSSLIATPLANGFTSYLLDFSSLSNQLQNGAPDGIALVLASAVQEFISYEGTFTAADGAATGMTSTDIGVNDNASPSSISRIGSGQVASDFTWALTDPPTPGAVNGGQALLPVSNGAVPEPTTFFVWSLLCGSALVGLTRVRATSDKALPSAGS